MTPLPELTLGCVSQDRTNVKDLMQSLTGLIDNGLFRADEDINGLIITNLKCNNIHLSFQPIYIFICPN